MAMVAITQEQRGGFCLTVSVSRPDGASRPQAKSNPSDGDSGGSTISSGKQSGADRLGLRRRFARLPKHTHPYAATEIRIALRTTGQAAIPPPEQATSAADAMAGADAMAKTKDEAETSARLRGMCENGDNAEMELTAGPKPKTGTSDGVRAWPWCNRPKPGQECKLEPRPGRTGVDPGPGGWGDRPGPRQKSITGKVPKHPNAGQDFSCSRPDHI